MVFNKLMLCSVLAVAGAVAAPAQELFRIMNLEQGTVWSLVPMVRPASATAQRFQAGRPQGMALGFASEPTLTLGGGELLEFRQAGAGAMPTLAFDCHDPVSGRRFTLTEPSGPAGPGVAGAARWDGAARTWYLEPAAVPQAGSAQQAATPGPQEAPFPASAIAAARAVRQAKDRALADFERQRTWGLAWVDREVRRVLVEEAEASRPRPILDTRGHRPLPRPIRLPSLATPLLHPGARADAAPAVPRPLSLASLITPLLHPGARAGIVPAAPTPAGQPRHPRAALPGAGPSLPVAAEPRSESKTGAPQSLAGDHPGKRTRATFEQGQESEDPRPWKRARSGEPEAAPAEPGAAHDPATLGLGPAAAATDRFNPTTNQTIINNEDRDWLLLMPKLDRVLEIQRFPALRGQERKAGKAPREFLDPADAWTTTIEANSVVRFLIPTDHEGRNLDFGLACADGGDALSQYVPFRWAVDGITSRVQPLWEPCSDRIGPWHGRCSVDPGSLSITLAPAGAGAGWTPAPAGDDWLDSSLSLDGPGSAVAR